ncbi:hypothetical protein ACFQVC_01060 [Streptomyces monticola]|uniref:Uncharacterized protein n=1 Tax=Streptomyces monticola TaxID=2666263 RepID=A0ABW2JAV8_9ACTN
MSVEAQANVPAGARPAKVTEVKQPQWVPFALAVIGTGAGFAVKHLAQWLVTLPRAPFKGPAETLTAVPEPWLTVGLLVAGAVVGLLAGFIILHEELAVRVAADRVVLSRADSPREFARGQVAMAARDGKDLVLIGTGGEQLAREECDFTARRLAAAFTTHGYAWAAADPHAGDFRRWVPDTPGLPAGADALFKAREKALERSDGTSDARELHEELARLGVYVRDSKSRQYWRVTVSTGA